MKIETLRKIANREEIDYPFLLSALAHYAQPRDKISSWLKSGDLIRVKKGLYVFGQSASIMPYSQEILANLIYGPSAISLISALSLHGLIPERVSIITSITPKRNKKFATPVGEFIYYYLPPQKYAIGIELLSSTSNAPYLIATPEKALCDQISLIDRSIKLESLKEIQSYLFHDLRIDEIALKKLRVQHLREINKIYQDDKIKTLIHFIEKWKK